MAAWAMQMQIGPYVLLAPINAGGTGELWRAFDTRLDRIVAIKRLDGSHGARFEQEAREIAALHHPHICALYDIDPDYLVMEYVEGETLSKVMERGPLPLQNALRYAMEIAGALAAAHAKGIVHRELNPGNVLITSQGVKLLNFAPAKTDQPVAVDQLTQTMGLATMGLSMQGQILGTLQYMSPEQVNGAEAGPLSDIFSF